MSGLFSKGIYVAVEGMAELIRDKAAFKEYWTSDLDKWFDNGVDTPGMSARQGRRNLLHLMFDPAGMRPFIANWPEAARSLLTRVHREVLGHIIDVNTKRLLDELSKYPGVESEWRTPTPADAVPVIPLAFTKGGVTLNYFSMITTVGTPQTVAAEEIRIECMYAADDLTEEAHARFVNDHSHSRT